MKIISGGQTGSDRGALEAALELGNPYGGWIPKGRKAEDGKVPEVFTELQEHPSPGYSPRTYANVRDADATVIICRLPAAGGSKLTVRYCREQEKPFLLLSAKGAMRGFAGQHQTIETLGNWLRVTLPIDRKIKVRTLNVAGSRESTMPGLQVAVKQIVRQILLDPVLKEQGRD